MFYIGLLLSILFTVSPLYAKNQCPQFFKDMNETQITAESIFRGRIDPKNLIFKYSVGKTVSDGVQIAVYLKGHKEKIAYIWTGEGLRNPQILWVEVKNYHTAGDMTGKGLGAFLYLVTAKLNFEAYKKSLRGSTKQQTEEARKLWQNFIRRNYANIGDGFGQFKRSFLESNQLNELFKYFLSRAKKQAELDFFED